MVFIELGEIFNYHLFQHCLSAIPLILFCLDAHECVLKVLILYVSELPFQFLSLCTMLWLIPVSLFSDTHSHFYLIYLLYFLFPCYFLSVIYIFITLRLLTIIILKPLTNYFYFVQAVFFQLLNLLICSSSFFSLTFWNWSLQAGVEGICFILFSSSVLNFPSFGL